MTRPAGPPALVRIPFSHFCRKAEWGLTQAGIPYDGWNLLPHATLRLPPMTRHGLVPILLGQEGMIEGSDRILAWADQHAASGTPPLYPDRVADDVRDWEDWAGDVAGPVARREAYRVAHDDPGGFTDRRTIHAAARLARPYSLGILKHLKARRYEDEDAAAVPSIVERIVERLDTTGTGYLFTDHPTAGDIATAALMEPLVWASPGREYAGIEGWNRVQTFIGRVRPPSSTRRRSLWMRKKQWRVLGRWSEEHRSDEPARTKGQG